MTLELGTSGEVASRLGAELRGPSDVVLTSMDTVERSREGTVTFLRDAKHLDAWASCAGSAVIVARGLTESDEKDILNDGRPVLVVDDADLAVITLLESVEQPRAFEPGVHQLAYVHPSARVAPGASVGPHARVGEGAEIGEGAAIDTGAVIGESVVIGAGSVVHANAVVYASSVIGRGTVIHAGAVIGADGFGYRPAPDGRSILKVPHIGRVEIGDGVEIGANTTIDRGKFGATVIGDGTKIDNLVMIGHNCRIGRMCIICGCVGISGSVTIGDGVTLAGGVGIADNVEIGAGATIGGQAGVMGDVPAGATYLGAPARDAKRFMRNAARFDQLDEVFRKIKPLLRDST